MFGCTAREANLSARNSLVARTKIEMRWTKCSFGYFVDDPAFDGIQIRHHDGEFLLTIYPKENIPSRRVKGSFKYCKAIAECWVKQMNELQAEAYMNRMEARLSDRQQF